MMETYMLERATSMLVTVLAILDANIYYPFTLASGTNIQKMSTTLL